MTTTTKSIGLWLDTTSSDEPKWVVSRDDESTSRTVATFAEDDYADALILAKDESQRTGYPVIGTDQHGNRETVYELAE
jgi:hypothetical protein